MKHLQPDVYTDAPGVPTEMAEYIMSLPDRRLGLWDDRFIRAVTGYGWDYWNQVFDAVLFFEAVFRSIRTLDYLRETGRLLVFSDLGVGEPKEEAASSGQPANEGWKRGQDQHGITQWHYMIQEGTRPICAATVSAHGAYWHTLNPADACSTCLIRYAYHKMLSPLP